MKKIIKISLHIVYVVVYYNKGQIISVHTAFIMAFFSNSKCDGVIYIRDCDYVWPNKRACIVNDPNDGKRRGMTEFWPYKGTWPDSANELIWNGQQGVDMDGFIVGTCPVIEFKART